MDVLFQLMARVMVRTAVLGLVVRAAMVVGPGTAVQGATVPLD